MFTSVRIQKGKKKKVNMMINNLIFVILRDF